MTLRSLLPFDWGRPAAPDLYADTMTRFQRDMSRLLDDAFRGAGRPALAEGAVLAPRMDVKETEKEILLTAELPGVDEKDVEVTLVDDLLTIKGEKKSQRREEKKDDGYVLTERAYGSFQRSLRLPFPVAADGVKAAFDKGILSITIAKPAEKVAATRKIPIATS
ncbi:MAG: Hsp20/alpha crystallin family protein [Alphaproteobacteria bacterium]